MIQADVKPLERGVLIASVLLERREISVRQAAAMCEVSERTAQRDLQSISRMLPLVTERNGREIVWRIMAK